MKKVALYMRLSREDEDTMDESNSISNQRRLLYRHIRSVPELRKVETLEFQDDGFTGKNMDRPGMQEMLKMVRAQKIDCIVVKDISRFSRDYLETGKYMEQIFPFMGVRFIAINDHYDSRDCAGGIGEIDVAFKGILYDFYSEDLSGKIRSSLEVKKAGGMYLGAVAPYGYRHDPDRKGHLVVDEESAEIVKRIFREYAGGSTIRDIVRGLNREGIEAPSVKMKLNLGKRQKASEIIWRASTVSRMLRNRMYLGCVIYHKNEQESIGGREAVVKDRKQWKVVEGTHEALVSREEFEAVQKRLEGNRKHPRAYPKHCLSGKVRCGICNLSMAHNYKGKPQYICTHILNMDPEGHERHFITDEELEAAVLEALQKEIELKADAGDLIDELEKVKKKRLNAAEQKLREAEWSLERVYAEQAEAFEAYKAGDMEKADYLEMSRGLETNEIELEEEIRVLREDVMKLDGEIGDLGDEEKENKMGIGTEMEMGMEMGAAGIAGDARGSVVMGLTDDAAAGSDLIKAANSAAGRHMDGAMKGLAAEDGRVCVGKLTREIVEKTIDEVIVWPGMKVDVKWKFKK